MSANQKWGAISSIQNDEQGQPGWIVAGHWMMEMGSQNDTATSDTNNSMISSVSGFHAMLQMVRLNGSAMHNHEISNFTQTGDATFNGDTNSTTITGTATITMREGPVPNVPIKIEIAQDKVIAITPDPAAVQNHFGNTPIYGIVISPEMIKEMMMQYGQGVHMMNNMTGMGGGMMQGPSGTAGVIGSEGRDVGEAEGVVGSEGRDVGEAQGVVGSEGRDVGAAPPAVPPSETLDAGETPMEGNMTTSSSANSEESTNDGGELSGPLFP
jgi:hypothetical protein